MKLFGDVVKSRLNKDVPPVGYVARPGRPYLPWTITRSNYKPEAGLCGLGQGTGRSTIKCASESLFHAHDNFC
jgi:hypothetical protein